MKIEFKNDKEKEVLIHILKEWILYNNDMDELGCQPACRNPESPGCEWCVEDALKYMLDKNELNFIPFGGEEWLLECTIAEGAEPKGY